MENEENKEVHNTIQVNRNSEKKRTYIRKPVFRRMLEKTGYHCCICHKAFFVFYHIDGNTRNNSLNNLVPICSYHDPKDISGLNPEKIRKRRKNICCYCNKPFISLHHIDGDVTNVKPDNLVLLCRTCHIRSDINLHLAKNKLQEINRVKTVRDAWYAFLTNKGS